MFSQMNIPKGNMIIYKYIHNEMIKKQDKDRIENMNQERHAKIKKIFKQ